LPPPLPDGVKFPQQYVTTIVLKFLPPENIYDRVKCPGVLISIQTLDFVNYRKDALCFCTRLNATEPAEIIAIVFLPFTPYFQTFVEVEGISMLK